MKHFVLVSAAFVAFLLGAPSALSAAPFQQIMAPDPLADEGIAVTVGSGSSRVVYPSCAGGPRVTESGVVATDRQYSFFLREGDAKHLLIALDGGGACMDPNTCIATALLGDATYQQEVGDPADVDDLGGIGDTDNPANPFRSYTQAFAPYCTADVFWGSRETAYDHALLADGPWTIHHRGFDNLLWVFSELMAYYAAERGVAPEKVVLVGGSAGGYGVALALPALKRLLPQETQVYVLADSANGVISEDFYNRALGGTTSSGGVWGVAPNVPAFLEGAFTQGARALPVAVHTALATQYPDARIGQYTTAFDAVQIFYYNLSKHIDQPSRWADPRYLLPAALTWTGRMREDLELIALEPNSRYYIGAGLEHTVLGSDRFYAEDSAQNVEFRDWLDAMVNAPDPDAGDWRNVSCAPFCVPFEDLLPFEAPEAAH